ncbi:MAG TPA: zinc ribbon domain-containing protein [Solirubrobacteraceae bacterium]|nr:zinc ribbon domain-containing protein [Solirubrobacteraceae bacterium]
MDQPSATTSPAATAAPEQTAASTDDAQPAAAREPRSAGFGSRGRVRRRARFLHKARELAYRDLGGLVYSLHRFGQRNDSLVLAKLATLTRIDAELRGLEASLSERQPVTVLREAGITACPRCAAIHSGEDRFCPNCGLPMSRSVDLLGDFQSAAGAAAATGAPPATPVPQAAPAAAPPPAPPAPASSSAATASFAPVPAAPTPASASAGAAASGVPAATQGSPVTQAHPVTPPPAHGAPVTQAHPVAPGAGRSPVPPGSSAKSGEDDQPTEIIRPPASGS